MEVKREEVKRFGACAYARSTLSTVSLASRASAFSSRHRELFLTYLHTSAHVMLPSPSSSTSLNIAVALVFAKLLPQNATASCEQGVPTGDLAVNTCRVWACKGAAVNRKVASSSRGGIPPL